MFTSIAALQRVIAPYGQIKGPGPSLKGGRAFGWIDRNGRIITAAAGLRSFAYGFLSVVLAIYLQLVGLGPFQIGLLITVILVGGAGTTLLASIYGDKIGRRRFLFVLSLLMAISGLIYALTSNIFLLMLGAVAGTLNPSGSEVSGFLSLEQAMLPQSSPPERRNSLFGVYNLVSQLAGAAGALFSALPVLFQSQFHYGPVESYRPLFFLYSALALSTAVLYLLVSPRMEAVSHPFETSNKITPESRGRIAKFSAILAVDAFSGGFVIQTVISYWFFSRFGTPLELLSTVFFVTGLVSSVSVIIAGVLADRIGAVRTMVFTHIPANFMLFGMALSPSFIPAFAFFLLRSMTTVMDVPARQAFTVSMVKPHERTTASGITNLSRNAARALSPSITGYALQFVSLGAPFFIAGILYTANDLTLYAVFRKTKELE